MFVVVPLDSPNKDNYSYIKFITVILYTQGSIVDIGVSSPKSLGSLTLIMSCSSDTGDRNIAGN